MNSSKKKQLKSVELNYFKTNQSLGASVSYNTNRINKQSETLKNINIHSTSGGQENTEELDKNRISFDIEDLRNEIKSREFRLLEREKEIEKIYNFESSSERESPYIKVTLTEERGAIETNTSLHPETTSEKDYKSYLTCCCKKICSVF